MRDGSWRVGPLWQVTKPSSLPLTYIALFHDASINDQVANFSSGSRVSHTLSAVSCVDDDLAS